jgi:hypothetical protein
VLPSGCVTLYYMGQFCPAIPDYDRALRLEGSQA